MAPANPSRLNVTPTIAEVPRILANPRYKDVSACIEPRLRRAWDAPLALRLWHMTSLDAPTVAVVWSAGFAWSVNIRLPAWALLLLALIVWAVYIADRLLDARAGLRTPSLHRLQERHYFHWRHRSVLMPLAACAALGAAWIVVALLPDRALKPDSLVAVATLAYFSGVHSRRKLGPLLPAFVSRECLVGALFSAGCVLPVWSQSPLSPGCRSQWLLVVPAIFFAAIAWLNCRAIGRWESIDPDSGGLLTAAAFLGVTGLVLAGLMAFFQPRSAALVAAGTVSVLLLAGLDRLRPHLTPLTLRAAADLVLLTPILLVPLTPGTI